MKDGSIIVIAAICIGVLAGSASLLFLFGNDVYDDSVPDYFGLSSTKLTLSTEDTDGYTLSTWSLPEGKSYSDISWASSNDSVATVTEGKIVGVAEGTATITAKLGSYTDTCQVTVKNGAVANRMIAYNAYSEKFDYAELSGDGFENGLLSLTFNANGAMVITLAGYDKAWLDYGTYFTGNATADFKSILMTFTQGDTQIDREYTNQYKNHKSFWDLGKSTSVADSTDTSMLVIDASKFTYGDCTIEFTLTTESGYLSPSKTYTVSGTISYKEGDGLFDTSGTYNRSYAWRFGTDSSSFIKYSFTISYPYSDYWNGYYKNTKLLNTDSYRNYKTYSWVTEFTTQSESVKLLAEKLKTAFGSYTENNYDFAEFVLAFGQISYEYGYDHSQYILGPKNDNESTDYWAYCDQTIFSGFGDCEDTSILLASILKTYGYSTACVVLPSHMTFAVALDGTSYLSTVASSAYSFEKDGHKYYLCETTVKAPTVEYKVDYRW